MTVQKMLEIQRYLHHTRPDLLAGSHDWWDTVRVISGLENITFSGNAKISLSQVKDDLIAMIQSEMARHEDELELSMVQHEASIRLENKYHKNRIAELNQIQILLNDRIETRLYT